jgi:hypothetical protein
MCSQTSSGGQECPADMGFLTIYFQNINWNRANGTRVRELVSNQALAGKSTIPGVLTIARAPGTAYFLGLDSGGTSPATR